MAGLTIQLKRLGKKKIKILPYTIAAAASLDQLIASCVRAEIAHFNAQREDVRLLPFLTPAQIDQQAGDGKIGFGDLANRELADAEKGIAAAKQAFLDGLFTVFVDDEEVRELDAPLNLTEDSTVTFLRLTFLTGTFW